MCGSGDELVTRLVGDCGEVLFHRGFCNDVESCFLRRQLKESGQRQGKAGKHPLQRVLVDEHVAGRCGLWARGRLWLAMATAVLALRQGRGGWEGERDWLWGAT